jgi:hypothetical protein
VACMTTEKDRKSLEIREIKWSVYCRYSEFLDLDKCVFWGQFVGDPSHLSLAGPCDAPTATR